MFRKLAGMVATDGHGHIQVHCCQYTRIFFGRPKGLAADREGRVYVLDAAFDVAQVFAPNGQVLAILGGPGTTPGTLTLPSGIDIDYDNVDYFRKYAKPGFELEYIILVANQFGKSKVNVFGFGRMKGMDYTDSSTTE